MPEAARDIELGADVRRQVFLIFKESVHNIVRHSGCTCAAVTFSAGREQISPGSRASASISSVVRARQPRWWSWCCAPGPGLDETVLFRTV